MNSAGNQGWRAWRRGAEDGEDGSREPRMESLEAGRREWRRESWELRMKTGGGEHRVVAVMRADNEDYGGWEHQIRR